MADLEVTVFTTPTTTQIVEAGVVGGTIDPAQLAALTASITAVDDTLTEHVEGVSNKHPASDVTVTDSGALYAASDVEAALAEVMNVAVFLAGALNTVARGIEILFGDNSNTEFDLEHNLGTAYPDVTIYDVSTGLKVEDNEGVATDSDTWHVGPLATVYPSNGLRAVFIAVPA